MPFKDYAEDMSEGGRDDLYTKSITPFLRDKELCPPEHILPLQVGVLCCWVYFFVGTYRY